MERKDILDQIVKQNHNPLTKGMKEDQGQDSKGTAITVENQDTNKPSVEQGSIHWNTIKKLIVKVRVKKKKSLGNMKLSKTL